MDVKLPKINKDWALFYGILLGDGSIGLYKAKGYKNKYNYNVNITCNAFDDLPFFEQIVLPLFERLISKKPNWRIAPNNSIRINICNKWLYYALKKLGFPSGKKGPNIIIPNIFYKHNLI